MYLQVIRPIAEVGTEEVDDEVDKDEEEEEEVVEEGGFPK